MAKSRLIVKHREVNEREVAAQVNISLSVMWKHPRGTFVIYEISDMHSINVDTSLNILLQNARLMMLEPQQEEEEEEEAQEEQLAGSGQFIYFY